MPETGIACLCDPPSIRRRGPKRGVGVDPPRGGLAIPPGKPGALIFHQRAEVAKPLKPLGLFVVVSLWV